MNQFDINDDLMRGAVAKALLETVTPETRDRLLRTALENVMKPTKNPRGYGADDPSVLQQAYTSAVYNITHQTAHEWLTNDEDFRKKVKGLFTMATEKVFSSPDIIEQISGQMASALTDAFKKTSY